jgi:hypothetical protein
MTLFEAQPPDPRRERRKRLIIIGAIALIVVAAVLFWLFRYWPQRHVASEFFSALQKGRYEEAYGMWLADPQWKQHPQKYSEYTYGAFYNDWGPPGEYGKVNSFHIDCASAAPRGGNGTIVLVTVNRRAEPAKLFVSDGDKSISYWPWEARCGVF